MSKVYLSEIVELLTTDARSKSCLDNDGSLTIIIDSHKHPADFGITYLRFTDPPEMELKMASDSFECPSQLTVSLDVGEKDGLLYGLEIC